MPHKEEKRTCGYISKGEHGADLFIPFCDNLLLRMSHMMAQSEISPEKRACGKGKRRLVSGPAE
ncbi:hypothetical protein PHLCEN_2v13210 [Hermanssonia centrifuga]|uniref:Uncharacterized protein n=1 Tax=Hermanssonia centrifuga TaxID=98765 RepID=A0A2R6NEW6_9APHY|nr:hypothetical protein PHLCEN_2v13210 [Hermanssonia centrifuga]